MVKTIKWKSTTKLEQTKKVRLFFSLELIEFAFLSIIFSQKKISYCNNTYKAISIQSSVVWTSRHHFIREVQEKCHMQETYTIPFHCHTLVIFSINLFLRNVQLLCSLKNSVNQRFSDVFRGYRNLIFG